MKDYTHIIEVRLYDGETPVNEFRYINDTTIKIGNKPTRPQVTALSPASCRIEASQIMRPRLRGPGG